MPAPLTEWLSKTDARKFWRDAPADDDTLDLYLSIARDEIEAFGERQVDPDAIPAGWRMAQWMHARNTYNAGKASPGGDMDGSSFGLVSVPLDWKIQQLVRPRRAIGAVV